jgi:hypothetical protein
MVSNKILIKIVFLFLAMSFFGYAQNTYVIKGEIVDASSGLGIPYVNIGIVGESIGTVSNDDGAFFLEFPQRVSSKSIFQISSIGYISQTIDLPTLVGSGFSKIMLKPDITALNEVIVSAKRTENYKTEIVGYTHASRKKIGYWKGDGSLGGELVTKIWVNKETRRLNTFQFHVLQNSSDSLLMRVNLYTGNTIVPKEKLNKKNIYHTIKTKGGLETVDLIPFDIFVEGDFMIGLELLKVYGGADIDLVLAATEEPGYSFRKYASQGNWEKFRGDAMTFSLVTSAIKNGTSVASISKDKALLSLDQSLAFNPLEDLTKVGDAIFKEISGMVFSDGKALSNVNVVVAGSSAGAKTDTFGRYIIMAKVGDELLFSHLGLQTVSESIDDFTSTVNINMFQAINELENVNVIADRRFRKSEKEKDLNYDDNYEYIKTRGGIEDKTISGTAIEIVEISRDYGVNPDLLQLVAHSFSGAKIGDYVNSRGETVQVIYLRGRGSILNPRPAIYEVDGVIFDEIPITLNTQNIKRIAKIAGPMATAKYGSIAAGGIFIINTHVANYSPKGNLKSQSPIVASPKTYQGDALSPEVVRKSLPQYIIDLEKAVSYDEAVKTYQDFKKIYGTFPYFYLDALHYFLNNWNDGPIKEDIVMESEEVLHADPKYSRALAYVYENADFDKEALSVYEELFRRSPNQSQSFASLAKSYYENGQYQKSVSIYGRYNYLLNENFLVPDTNATHAVLVTDFEKLINEKKDELAIELVQDATEKEVSNDRMIRVVFEWNDSSANFVLQFVDKNQMYFNWDNWEQNELGQDGQYLGSKQFEIATTDDSTTEWLVNVTYKGNGSLTPSYIKATIYHDFGLESETKEVKLFRLGIKDLNHELFRITDSNVN